MSYCTQHLLSDHVLRLGAAGQLATFQIKLATSVPLKVRKCACAVPPDHFRSGNLILAHLQRFRFESKTSLTFLGRTLRANRMTLLEGT